MLHVKFPGNNNASIGEVRPPGMSNSIDHDSRILHSYTLVRPLVWKVRKWVLVRFRSTTTKRPHVGGCHAAPPIPFPRAEAFFLIDFQRRARLLLPPGRERRHIKNARMPVCSGSVGGVGGRQGRGELSAKAVLNSQTVGSLTTDDGNVPLNNRPQSYVDEVPGDIWVLQIAVQEIAQSHDRYHGNTRHVCRQSCASAQGSYSHSSPNIFLGQLAESMDRGSQ